MRWEGRRESENVEDRRGVGAPTMVGGGLLMLLLMVGLMFLGVDPQQAVGIGRGLAPAPRAQPSAKPVNDAGSRFIKTVLAENEDVWSKLFPPSFQGRYVPAKLVMFTGQVQSGCGMASAASGPFYCPLDRKVYIDLAFYDEQRSRLLPWLLPDLVQGFFDGRFSEDDKNQLIGAARAHALAQAQGLAERYRAQVERSAFNTLALLVRPLGYANLEVRFAPKQELSTDVGTAALTQSDPLVAMPVPAGETLLTTRGPGASS